ncbi:hypothetical protein ANO14919_056680 [Xylariales sp. No.14919]|nr:histidine phosphatase superfamily [Xylaria grammica]GAW16245.1 hypothetical protein ANO14919_056680 [Xylariales sp. No.14919]
MPPTIHIIRTAQGAHYTRDSGNIEYHDPVLTKEGYEQCTELASEIAGLGHKFELVIASPMKRSIQTAIAVFREYLRSKKIVLLPDLQELGMYPGDTGSPQGELERIFGTDVLDYYFVGPDWTDKSPGSRSAFSSLFKRAHLARHFIRSVARTYRDTDAHIAVLTHSHFINYLLTGYSDTSVFKFAERRAFRHVFEEEDGLNSRLEETPDSVARREKKRLDAIPKGDYYLPFGFKVPEVPTVAETEQPSNSWMFAHKI